jgi:hypothetical protein
LGPFEWPILLKFQSKVVVGFYFHIASSRWYIPTYIATLIPISE